MKTKAAIKFFGGSETALAEALGITPPAIYQWKKFPPAARQLQIEKVSGGALKAEAGCLDKVLGLDKLKAAEPERV